jgi:hypothetical protein
MSLARPKPVNTEITPPVAALTPDSAVAFWPRFLSTFGPALVGLLGGALTVGVAFVSIPPILRACSQTYARYPSVQAPWLAGDFTLPSAVTIPLFVLAVVSPFALGLVTARLVRPRDRWEAVSAGLTTAAAGSATAYVLWIGWKVAIATVLVPSVSDMTLLAESTRTPAAATAAPSDVLADQYPDLKGVPGDERGALFFPKIMSDQVVGSAHGVWIGVVTAVGLVGLPSLCGTLAAAWLLRRGGAWWVLLLSYVELTVAISVTLGLLLAAAVGFGLPAGWFRYAVLVAASVTVVTGVLKRWGFPLRVTAAVAWALVLLGVGFEDRFSRPISLVAAYSVYAGVGVLFVLRAALRRPLDLRFSPQHVS